ncbi:MAG: hypothetical protein ACLUTA_06295, partial [Blautia wexlerae]
IGQDEKKTACGSVITIFWTQIPMNRMYGQPAIRTDWKQGVTLGEHDDDLENIRLLRALQRKMRLHSRQRLWKKAKKQRSEIWLRQ